MNVDYREGATGAGELVVAEPLDRLVEELAELGRPGWRRVEAVFALTVSTETTRVTVEYDHRVGRVDAPESLVALARSHREQAAWTVAGPWWVLTVRVDESGRAEIDYDYGDEPFPGDQLLRPEAYRADIDAYPRVRLPLWLAAYINHGDRQSRGARRAAVASRADRVRGIAPTPVEEDFPELPLLWSRWAVLAAAHIAVGSESGPRVVPDTGWYESARNGSSGSSLYLLAGGRAVLSGGVWNAPALNAAYNGGIDLPNLYAGAPDWVTNAVLNPRAAVGLLSFCFWWDGDGWYGGESPSIQQCGAALPPIWSAGTVRETVARMLVPQPDSRVRAAVSRLLAAADCGVLTRALVQQVFGAERDIDGAMRQLRTAGVLAPRGAVPRPDGPPSISILGGRYLCDDRIAL
ncbi:hypothetical protein [Nocardia arthritidis]|uniref:Uncharacterized protein n=1 Tax=Nocardia arthritidis TaxID=228602 RepID=A0A6G9Y6V9_9NOCA|nr:hypothetical protein [Nocardia arthritidis]QIS08985.1 hypothetical protein F5544_05365 [Nocardia arthritidis]